jgi:hypothetical protein
MMLLGVLEVGLKLVFLLAVKYYKLKPVEFQWI